jgi:hypothetical protein
MCSATFIASNGTYSSEDELCSTHLTIICILIIILIFLEVIFDRYDCTSVFISELALTMGYVPSSGFWADIVGSLKYLYDLAIDCLSSIARDTPYTM